MNRVVWTWGALGALVVGGCATVAPSTAGGADPTRSEPGSAAAAARPSGGSDATRLPPPLDVSSITREADWMSVAPGRSGATTEPPPYLRPAIQARRAEAETLEKARAEAFWHYWTRGTPIDGKLEAGHDDLFAPVTVELIRAAARAATGDAARALQAFELYVAGEVVARQTAGPLQEWQAAEASARVASADGKPVALSELDKALAGEPDASRRAALARGESAAMGNLHALRRAHTQALDEAIRKLGYESGMQFAARLRGSTPESIETLARRVLDVTEVSYLKALDRLAQERLSMSRAQLHRADLPRLLRPEAMPAAVSGPAALDVVRKTLRGLLSLDPAQQPGLHLDADPGASKSPRSLCLPVQVPTDVRVAVSPDKADDLRELLHELGHAEVLVHIARPEWEFRHLGGQAVSEAFALLFEGIGDQPEWLVSFAGMGSAEAGRLARIEATRRLFLLRRQAGRVLYSVMHRAGRLENETPADVYRRILSRAYGVELTLDDAQRSVIDTDDLLESADDLRGWVLGAQLERSLVMQYGRRWWEQPEAGAWLRLLWRQGGQPTADEFARSLGASGLDPQALHQTLLEKAVGTER